MAPILFLHIPRTGGTSLADMCQRALGMDRCLERVHFLREDSLSDLDLMGLALIEGHVRPGFFERSSAASVWPAQGYTIVRDPASHVVSHALHARHRSEHADWWPEIMSEISDPQAFFERFPRLWNFQTRMLSGRRGAGLADEEMWHSAVALLDRMTFGLTNEYSASIALFMDRFEVHFREMIHTNSSTEGDPDIRSAEFKAASRAFNEFDQRLFDYASSQFAARVGDQVEALLGLDADDGGVSVELRCAGRDGAITAGPGAEEIEITGPLVIDGRPAEAALVRVGSRYVPVGCRFFTHGLTKRTGDASLRFAGMDGRVTIEPGVDSIEVIAFDRTRRLRGSARFDVIRDRAPDDRRIPVRRPVAPAPGFPDPQDSNPSRSRELAWRRFALLRRSGLQPTDRGPRVRVRSGMVGSDDVGLCRRWKVCGL